MTPPTKSPWPDALAIKPDGPDLSTPTGLVAIRAAVARGFALGLITYARRAQAAGDALNERIDGTGGEDHPPHP